MFKAIVLFVLLSFNAYAQDLNYNCTAKEINSLLTDKNIVNNIKSRGRILSVNSTKTGYQIITENCKVELLISYAPTKEDNQECFEFKFDIDHGECRY